MPDNLFAKEINDVVRSVGLGTLRNFSSKSEVAAVVRACDLGLISIVPFDNHHCMLVKEDDWSKTGSGLELTERGRGCFAELQKQAALA